MEEGIEECADYILLYGALYDDIIEYLSLSCVVKLLFLIIRMEKLILLFIKTLYFQDSQLFEMLKMVTNIIIIFINCTNSWNKNERYCNIISFLCFIFK